MANLPPGLHRVATVSVMGRWMQETGWEAIEKTGASAFAAKSCAPEDLPLPAHRRSAAPNLPLTSVWRIGAPDVRVDNARSEGANDKLALGLSEELDRQGVSNKATRVGIIDTKALATRAEPDRTHRLAATTGRSEPPAKVGEAIRRFLSHAWSYVSLVILNVAGGRCRTGARAQS